MEDRELDEVYGNKYRPAEINKPFMVKIPVSSIWMWFIKRKQKAKEKEYAKRKSAYDGYGDDH